MRILFTGASSFTGMWFVEKLAAQGHRVTALIQRSFGDYQGVRKARIEKIQPCVDLRFEISYGSKCFQDLIERESFDLFCHHAADVTNYKSLDFDYISALKNNVGNLSETLVALKAGGCQKMILTGSVFEPNEGAGSDGLRAVSPYGLSKGMTANAFQYFCQKEEMRLGKFVIPNPFGPYEELRFTSFLMQQWSEKKCAHVAFPDYVRDNIHVSLLADAYVFFAESLPDIPGYQAFNPSGYVGSQGKFTEIIAVNMRKRLSLPCEYTLGNQTEFLEPKERYNTDLFHHTHEEEAWDAFADYYMRRYLL